MAKELTLKEKAVVQNFFQAVANDLDRGSKKNSIVKWLEKQGWSGFFAREMVDNVNTRLSQLKATLMAKEVAAAHVKMLTLERDSGRHMLYGLAMAAGGIAVTAITYMMAEGGGTYIIAYGAVITGIIEFSRGFTAWIKRKP